MDGSKNGLDIFVSKCLGIKKLHKSQYTWFLHGVH